MMLQEELPKTTLQDYKTTLPNTTAALRAGVAMEEFPTGRIPTTISHYFTCRFHYCPQLPQKSCCTCTAGSASASGHSKRGGLAEFSLKGGGVQGGWVGGAVGGTPPPPGDPELLEAPKKFFGLN